MNTPFFMVYVENMNQPTVEYSIQENAESEAKRLADKTGKKVFVLCSLKSFETASRYTTKDLRPPKLELPF